jgi:hypothetical protein
VGKEKKLYPAGVMTDSHLSGRRLLLRKICNTKNLLKLFEVRGGKWEDDGWKGEHGALEAHTEMSQGNSLDKMLKMADM